jgi:hypothetical protein
MNREMRKTRGRKGEGLLRRRNHGQSSIGHVFGPYVTDFHFAWSLLGDVWETNVDVPEEDVMSREGMDARSDFFRRHGGRKVGGENPDPGGEADPEGFVDDFMLKNQFTSARAEH